MRSKSVVLIAALLGLAVFAFRDLLFNPIISGNMVVKSGETLDLLDDALTPLTDSEDDLGTSSVRFKRAHFDTLDATVNVGDLVTLAFDFGNDTFADQWVPARADSDIGIALNYAVILDSVGVLSTFGAGDTAIIRVYKTTANATLVSGPDTLTSASAGYQIRDLTGVSSATRTFSGTSTSRLALQVDEHGTLEQVSVLMWGRKQ